MPAKFYEQEVKSGLKDKRKLSAFLDDTLKKYREKTDNVNLTYIFCNDDYLLKMNLQFLDHDTYTDIITFDLGSEAGGIAGEIYISIERVAENAVKFGVSYNNELHRVIFHGALHLCGYKDKSAMEKKLMREMEDKCLELYFKQEHED
jgi:probable rRNA maturation factor